METKIAIAHLAESRSDFFEKRQHLVLEELRQLDWLRKEHHLIESDLIRSVEDVVTFVEKAIPFGAQSLIIHLPVWADPIFTIKLVTLLPLPVLLLGNNRPETSSTVGLLGAGGALDQIGYRHTRIFDHQKTEARQQVMAFVQAAASVASLRGKTLGLFGGRSLGIFTAVADPAQWQKVFGVDIVQLDQTEIIQLAESLPDDKVESTVQWLRSRLQRVEFKGSFTPVTLNRQVRSYQATRQLIKKHNVDFVGVKCQPELSDGYVSQCVAHLLLNSGIDEEGEKPIVIHACESDADGALTMQILHLVSGGKQAALLDIRLYDETRGIWTLANCGAIPAAFCATKLDPVGLSAMHMEEHVFGKGGGGAIPAQVVPQQVTLARLCRKSGQYWMAIVLGQVETGDENSIKNTTSVFPKAFVRSTAGMDFLQEYGSNHIHMASGDWTTELVAFCGMVGIDYKLWK